MPAEKDDLRLYLNNPEPFSLLNMQPGNKTLSQLYRELNFRAEEEFLEHCYRSKKNYTPAMFRATVFYRRYSFLKRHLRQLTYWLYRSPEFIPEDLKAAMDTLPDLTNPWGVKVAPKRLKKLNFFRKDL
ncbi:hypothetical protein [Salinimicrobium soli]|uniref:hypothetical protein n=1 Tax=Salinimicrobium soli TaxID=1254399 RepID=UPI003AAC700A